MRRLAIAVDEFLRHVLAVEREHLHPLAAAVGDIDEPVIRHARGVDGLHELRRSRTGLLLGGDAVILRDPGFRRHVIERFVAERTPHPLEGAGVGIEHDDAPVAVAVGDKQLVGRRIRRSIRRWLTLTVSLLPLLWPLWPICMTNLPALVNLTRWLSVLPLPPSQMKPLGSA